MIKSLITLEVRLFIRLQVPAGLLVTRTFINIATDPLRLAYISGNWRVTSISRNPFKPLTAFQVRKLHSAAFI